ncbi:MAG: SGNH/GDSL hydrolase family protein [Opitutaceae bacterium]|nr:SGNH/GDSL hydrolase family protein [Opitutaceae bacterium]
MSGVRSFTFPPPHACFRRLATGAAFAFSLVLACAGLVPASAAAGAAIRPGDRIAILGNTFADQLRVHGYFETLLLQLPLEPRVSVRNLGWAGDMLSARDRPTNFPAEEAALVAHQTDVIIACFGMGESFAGPDGLPAFRTALETFAASHRGRKYNGKSEVRLILVSPIACEDLGPLTPDRERRNRELADYTAAMEQVATRQELGFVNLFAPTLQLMADSTAPKLTTNGIHLNAYGYWAVSRLLADEVTRSPRSWALRIDARTGEASGEGLAIAHVEPAAGGVRFAVKEKRPPTPAPPIKGRIHPTLQRQRDILAVSNLAPGEYHLTIDGEPVITAGHERWAEGIAIDASPQHRNAEALRQAVNDKNQQWVYGWKALNQVHIVGERKASPSGRALPAEIIEFKRLADQRDQALRPGLSPLTHEWRLTPSSGPNSRP